jgi:hypothetical protein
MAKRPLRIEVIDELHARFIRPMSGAQRLEMTWDMWDWARTLVRAGLAQAHPDWDEPRLERETARRMLDASR